jgi:hypothetical protein
MFWGGGRKGAKESKERGWMDQIKVHSQQGYTGKPLW